MKNLSVALIVFAFTATGPAAFAGHRHHSKHHKQNKLSTIGSGKSSSFGASGRATSGQGTRSGASDGDIGNR